MSVRRTKNPAFRLTAPQRAAFERLATGSTEYKFLLWVAQTDTGLLTDDLIAPNVFDAAEELELGGFLIRGEPIEHIQVFRISAAGIEALGKTVQ